MAELHLTTGKAEFLKRKLSNGNIENICLCEHNADFAFACIGQVHGSLLPEVIKNRGFYDQDKIDQHRKEVGIDFRCDYCYAKRKNWGKIIPKEIGKELHEQFKEKPKIIRLGKNVECGHIFYRNELIKFLEICKEYQTRIIFPTKMLEFNQEIANLLIKTNSVVNYSICNDFLEKGPVSQGYSNKWRVSQAEQYAKEGANTTVTLTCDVTNSLKENSKRGFAIEEILNAQEQGLTLRLLPLRLNSREVCLKTTGKQWKEIVMPKDWENYKETLDFGITWSYSRKRNNEIRPLFFHEDFQEMIKKGVGVCGGVGKWEYCDKCNLEKDVRIVFPISELIPVEKAKKHKVTYKKYKHNYKKSEEGYQQNLFKN